MLAVLIASSSFASPASSNTCGGKPFGYPATTNCCVPDGAKFDDHRTGAWPTGTTYDYNKQRCDPVCGIMASQDPCTKGNTCGGQQYGAANHTDCCVPGANGTYTLEQSGTWPTGKAFDYTHLKCDPGCGVLESATQRCCSGVVSLARRDASTSANPTSRACPRGS